MIGESEQAKLAAILDATSDRLAAARKQLAADRAAAASLSGSICEAIIADARAELVRELANVERALRAALDFKPGDKP